MHPKWTAIARTKVGICDNMSQQKRVCQRYPTDASRLGSRFLVLAYWSPTHGKQFRAILLARTRWNMVNDSGLMLPHDRGIINSFGIYQEHYRSNLRNNKSASFISWIGTFQGFLLEVVSGFIRSVYDRGYLHAFSVYSARWP